VKLAVLLLYGADLESARSALERTGGRLRQALDLVEIENLQSRQAQSRAAERQSPARVGLGLIHPLRVVPWPAHLC
jgi:hypothetical protein